MNSLVSVVKKDFSDSIRSLTLLTATALMVVLTAAVYLFAWGAQDIEGVRIEVGTLGVFLLVQFLIGLIGILIGFAAIVGERERGSLKILLSLPPTRRDVFLGKFIGRFLVAATAIVSTFLVISLLSVATFGTVPVTDFVTLTLGAMLLAGIWVSLSVGLSAVSRSRTRAIASCLGLWIVLTILWDILLWLAHFLIEGGEAPTGAEVEAEPTWYLFVQQLHPVDALRNVMDSRVAHDVVPAFFQMPGQRGAYTLPERYHGMEGATEVPAYLTSEFALAVMIAWICVPLVIGYLRFRAADL